ncbi:5-formyltetrahydrofolate cyclo-ligase [Limimonas halophila]|uniref:5-formyltetrahydrofolate cyclo-ligase n=1 Tax=Limimonas halophila TaxID=1082479 RepID=A0A1G7M0A6_9PROT|nr:5-formyltetrahydrofolate cyclo-ligase [Limimonas halophila]SDF54580.1 5-formyltetrahydrofolate cyclo-ligase [Limimonas halophila]
MAETPAPDPASGQDPASRKKALRKQAKHQRAEAAAAHPDAGERLVAHVLAMVADRPGATVSAYWPMGDEIDPRPAITALYERGHTIGLPVMQGADTPLVFRQWWPDAPLADGGFGTRMPTEAAPVVTPEVLLVPLLAFNGAGYRLGYGGGFYDRTLEKLRGENPATLAVGLAYSGQRVDDLPVGPYDQPLDAIVTEIGPMPLRQAEG